MRILANGTSQSWGFCWGTHLPRFLMTACARPGWAWGSLSGRDALLPADLPRASSPVLDADPEVIELPWSLVFVLPLVPLLLPPELLQLAEAVREQEVWGQGWVFLLGRAGGGHRGHCRDGSSWGHWGWAR